MTIRRGEEWGTVGAPPDGLVRISDDAALGRLVNDHRSAGSQPPPVALLGGDLGRALGVRGDSPRIDAARTEGGGAVAILPVDVVRVDAADGDVAWFVSHLVAVRSWWRGALVGALNGQYLGGWDVSPRAHPNDGRVDVVRVEASMSRRDRWRARGRLPHGLHLPHPAISIRQVASTSITLDRRTRLVLDGVPWIETDRFALTVEPDALTVVV
jgi:hypothetical protein